MSKHDTPKIGAGHLAAWMRMGLRELRAAFYPESNIAQQPEMGLYGTALPSEVAEQRGADVQDRSDNTHSIIDAHVRQAESRAPEGRDDRQREAPEPERE